MREFADLYVDGDLEVQLDVGRELGASLTVTTDSNLLPLIHSSSRLGVLDIVVEDDTHLEPTTGAFVDLTTDRIGELTANNGAIVRLEGEGASLRVSANNGADILGASFEAEYVDVEANNGGRVVLVTEDAHVDVANGGEVELCASRDVRGTVRSGGELRVRCGGRDMASRR